MKRRNFLKIGGISAALVALPGVSLIYASSKSCAIDLILKEFHFLKVNPDDVEQYVNDIYSQFEEEKNTLWEMKIKAHYYFNVQSTSSRGLVKGFLQATDFFYNKMDEGKDVKYLGLYNAYQRPCANPFSHLYYPPQEQLS